MWLAEPALAAQPPQLASIAIAATPRSRVARMSCYRMAGARVSVSPIRHDVALYPAKTCEIG
jgi:hypothetical protein